MNFRFHGGLALAGFLALAATACQEQLTAPGACPATCPGGTPVVHDTVLDALVGEDSTFTGYLVPGSGASGLRSSNGFLGTTDRAFLAFDPMPDTLKVLDTVRTFTIDSAVVEIPLLQRDTMLSGIVLWLHRLPATIDTTATFAEVESFIVPGTVMDSVTVPDSIKGPHTFRFVFKGDTLANIAIPDADSGVLALAVAMTASTPTGVRVGGLGSAEQQGVPLFRIYVTVDIADTTTSVKKQTIARGATFTRSVSSNPTALDPDLLTLGTPADARAMIRFPWPAYLRDSALLARATLELTPDAPFDGLPGDSAWVNLYGITVDYGAKSPITGLRGTRPIIFGSTDTMRIDVISEVQAWQTGVLAIPHPPVIVARLAPAGGASYTEPRFRSTRSPAGAPRLRVTYQLPFDFERP